MNVDPKTRIATLSVEQMTMAQLVRNLGFPMLTKVLDRTGLSGAYRVTARWNANPGSREILRGLPSAAGAPVARGHRPGGIPGYRQREATATGRAITALRRRPGAGRVKDQQPVE